MRKVIIILLFLSIESTAQNGVNSFHLWQLMSKSGTASIRGHYRELEMEELSFINASENSFFTGGLKLNTRSSILHPNFMIIDLGAEYYPGKNKERLLVSPDHAESLTDKKLNLRVGLFEQKPMNISAFLNLNQNYTNREYVNSTKTDSKQWGTSYSFRNNIVPIKASYSKGEWDQIEIETGRSIKNRQSNFQSSITKSFFSTDNHELGFSYSDYMNENPNMTEIINRIDRLYLNNVIFFDADNKYSFRSAISNLNQKGTYTLNRLILRENISLKLPKKFTLSGKYSYQKNEQKTQQFNQNTILGRLDHKLFQSLKTGVFFQNNETNHNVYKESNKQAGISLEYVKKIPNGLLNLSYTSIKRQQNLEGDPGSLLILDEQHVLADDQIVLLNKPFVDLATVIIKNETGLIIYDINFDYVLIETGGYVEIQRIPGGQIANNAVLKIDYSAALVGTYKFDTDHTFFSARITLLDRLIQLYFNTSNQDYSNEETVNRVALNRYNQNTFGGRFEIGIFRAGVEFIDYQSNIIPYERTKYYFQLNGKMIRKIVFSLNADLSDTHLTDTDLDQIMSSVYGRIAYGLTQRSNLNLNLGYRKQEGKQIDLDLMTVRSEFTTAYRNLYFKFGLEMYRRIYVGYETNFKGAYFQIERRF